MYPISIFLLQADSETFKYIINHPLNSIEAIVMALGLLQIASNFIKWLEKTFKDEFICKFLIILSMIGFAFLYFAILYKFNEN